MTSRDFVYWLQGYLEVAKPTELSSVEIDLIQKHLAMVFVHEIDPSFPKEQKQALDNAHKKPSGSHHEPTVFRC